MEGNGTNEISNSVSCEHELCEIANYIWMILSPIIFVFGMVGGILLVLVFVRMKFWTTPLMIFLFVLTTTDMVILCVGLIRLWILETWDFDIRSLSDAVCKLLHFLVYFSMQFSSWILVCVTIERFIKCKYITYKSIVTVKKSAIAISILMFVLGCLNSHYFWSHGFVTNDNNVSICNVTPGYETFDDWYIKADLFVLCVIPFCIMLSLDLVIMRSLKTARTFRRSSVAAPQMYSRTKKVDQRLTKMLVFTNSYFLISTLPVSILFVLTIYLDSRGENMNVIFTFCGSIVYTLQYSNYAVNCIFYTVFDKKIRKHLTRLLRVVKPR
jgi:hypothetical protein